MITIRNTCTSLPVRPLHLYCKVLEIPSAAGSKNSEVGKMEARQQRAYSLNSLTAFIQLACKKSQINNNYDKLLCFLGYNREGGAVSRVKAEGSKQSTNYAD